MRENGAGSGSVFTQNLITDDFQREYMRRFNNDTHITYAANTYDYVLQIAEVFSRFNAPGTAEEIIETSLQGLPLWGRCVQS